MHCTPIVGSKFQRLGCFLYGQNIKKM